MKYCLLLIVGLALSACGGSNEEDPGYEGREDTKKLQAVEAVGYDGDALRKNVDNMLNKNEQRQQELEDAQD